jgi:hypothetical protein
VPVGAGAGQRDPELRRGDGRGHAASSRSRRLFGQRFDDRPRSRQASRSSRTRLGHRPRQAVADAGIALR